jgi:hypothetical protein
MKKTTLENQFIADMLPFKFESEEYNLNGWGEVDFYAYHGEILVLLEVEKGQKHPNTNVLKLWPYLEANNHSKILLIQIIRLENKAPKNRLNLCEFTGQKLEGLFPNRFVYIFAHLVDIKKEKLLQLVEQKLKHIS